MQKNITENTCLVCLTEQEILINLFDEVEDFQTKLSDLLECCGDLKVDLGDNYPKLICGDCTNELLVAAKFREKCKRTREILSQFISTIESTCDSDVTEDVPECPESPLPPSEPSGNEECLEESVKPEEATEDDTIVECKEEVITDDPHVEIITAEIFDQVEFLESNEADGHYIIFNESDAEEDEPAPVNSIEETDDMQKSDENPDHDLYQRIIRAAKTAAKYNPKQHMRIKPLVINCKCDICGAGFMHQSNLRRHLHKHNSCEVYNCSICSSPFASFEKLEAHIKQHKEVALVNENQLAEKENSKAIINPSGAVVLPNLKRNRKKITLEEMGPKKLITSHTKNIDEPRVIKRNHKCSQCEKWFVSKSSLNAHMRIHTGDRPFRCTECIKTFTTQGGLVLHMRRHTGHRPFTCNVCGKGFVESSNLKVHMRMHTGEKPHKCTICGRSFARVFLLQIHQRTHTGERPYQCPYCDKAFAQQGDLASHKRIHTGERPHKCLFCSKGFIKSSALTQHMRKHSKFEGSIGRSQTNANAIKGEDQLLPNYDILIVEEDETMQSDENNVNDKDNRPTKLGVVVECPNDVDEPN